MTSADHPCRPLNRRGARLKLGDLMKFVALVAVMLALLPATAGHSVFDYLWYSADQRAVIRLIRSFDDLFGASGPVGSPLHPNVDDPPLTGPQTAEDWQRLAHRHEGKKRTRPLSRVRESQQYDTARAQAEGRRQC